MTSKDRTGQGAMTGATGSLTPDDSEGPFVPAEQREISRLAPDEPADRTEERPEAVQRPPAAPRTSSDEHSIGGDVIRDPDEEHM
jgi:hypothetical protein